ncbi:MAG: DUF1080 domain-containing protein [Planctomycetaceae bacterium]|nr:DUF1080 domain-containing protein [Planctomycetaceae bacterium]
MRLVTTVVVFFLSLTIYAPGSVADEEAGFEVLFDGKSLAAWRGYRQNEVPPNWLIENGEILGTGKGPDLLTKSVYGNFDFRFQWKLSASGNSGVVYRVSENEERTQHKGPEYQLVNRKPISAESRPTTACGSLYGLYGESKITLQPDGEFNRSRIVVEGNRIRHWLNGEKVVDCEVGSEDWNKKIEASQFHAWPQFAQNQQGHIVLQAADSPVWFRELHIKPLPRAPKDE